MTHLKIEFYPNYPRPVGNTRVTLDGEELPILGDAQLVRYTHGDQHTIEVELEGDPFTRGDSGLPAPLEAALTALGWTPPPTVPGPGDEPTAPEAEAHTEWCRCHPNGEALTEDEVAREVSIARGFLQPKTVIQISNAPADVTDGLRTIAMDPRRTRADLDLSTALGRQQADLARRRRIA